MAPDNKSVLMVSNRNLLTDAVGAHLRAMGLNVLVAATGKEGIARLSADIKTTIVDAKTPGMEEFLDRVKDRGDIRALLVSDGPVAPELIGPNILLVPSTQGLTYLLSLLSLPLQMRTDNLRDAIVVAGNRPELVGLRAAMEAEGMVVASAANTAEVEDVLSRRRVRVLVLDISLPGEGGLGTLRLVKESFPLAEVIVVGPPDKEIARHAIDLGAFDYIHETGDTVAFQTAVRMASSHSLFREEFSIWRSLWPFRSRHAGQNEPERATSAELIAKRRQLIRKLGEVRSALTDEEADLAMAIDSCVGRAAGGDFHCPVGQLYLMDYLKGGYSPKLVHASGGPALELEERLKADGPRRVLDSIFSQFEDLAAVEHDEEFRTALQECRHDRESCGSCPLHSFLSKPRK